VDGVVARELADGLGRQGDAGLAGNAVEVDGHVCRVGHRSIVGGQRLLVVVKIKRRHDECTVDACRETVKLRQSLVEARMTDAG
jgi:hypothetical protein